MPLNTGDWKCVKALILVASHLLPHTHTHTDCTPALTLPWCSIHTRSFINLYPPSCTRVERERKQMKGRHPVPRLTWRTDQRPRRGLLSNKQQSAMRTQCGSSRCTTASSAQAAVSVRRRGLRDTTCFMLIVSRHKWLMHQFDWLVSCQFPVGHHRINDVKKIVKCIASWVINETI